MTIGGLLRQSGIVRGTYGGREVGSLKARLSGLGSEGGEMEKGVSGWVGDTATGTERWYRRYDTHGVGREVETRYDVALDGVYCWFDLDGGHYCTKHENMPRGFYLDAAIADSDLLDSTRGLCDFVTVAQP